MSITAISRALEERIADLPALGLIIWENKDAQPPTPYLVFENVRTTTEDDTISGGNTLRAGYLMITIVSDTDKFTTPSTDLAEMVIPRFPYAARIPVDGGGHVLIVKPAHAMQGFTDGIHWRQPVRIDYQAFI